MVRHAWQKINAFEAGLNSFFRINIRRRMVYDAHKTNFLAFSLSVINFQYFIFRVFSNCGVRITCLTYTD